ncbi:HAD-IIA family hydrolase [Blastococcus saxobsidens]|uniref:Putative sugar phosphatases of the HAD superfamily n=1 Tax=Blastococcus saxobsidens (strain DD2) TaxID=1146883 RepID=H6RIN8_BLASD|nr:HAD family hydrolase [Blastococcus saxobsidens]CCG02232.1 Putative sugar phosphatases of the HAD superfamily [Blastococcus saxobsidens DD2]
MPDTAVLDRLRQVRGFVLDMDGTLVMGDRNNQGLVPLPGALDLVPALVDLGFGFCVYTNGTVKTPAQCADALRRLGLPVTAEQALTPASTAVDVFLERGHRRVMVLGGKGITEPLEAAGIETVPPLRGTDCDAVMAGWYRQELSFEALEAACFAVFDGAEFYSASQSLFFATAEGRSLGTSRAISAVVRDVTGCEVTVVGKPSLRALQTAARRLDVSPAELAVVGDDPELEVPMAHAGGAFAVAVHTGIGHAESYAELPAEVRPHLDLPDVGELARLLRS